MLLLPSTRQLVATLRVCRGHVDVERSQGPSAGIADFRDVAALDEEQGTRPKRVPTSIDADVPVFFVSVATIPEVASHANRGEGVAMAIH